jgi:hypothetical protein
MLSTSQRRSTKGYNEDDAHKYEWWQQRHDTSFCVYPSPLPQDFEANSCHRPVCATAVGTTIENVRNVAVAVVAKETDAFTESEIRTYQS